MTVVWGRARAIDGMYGGSRAEAHRAIRVFDAAGLEVESALTDDLGTFSLDLAPGSYRLRAELAVPLEQVLDVGDQDLSLVLVWSLR